MDRVAAEQMIHALTGGDRPKDGDTLVFDSDRWRFGRKRSELLDISSDPFLDLDGRVLYLYPNRSKGAASIRYVVRTDREPTEAEVATGTVSVENDIPIHTYAGDDEIAYVGVLPFQFGDGSGVWGDLKLLTQPFQAFGEKPTIFWMPIATSSANKEAVRLITRDNGDEVATYIRTYTDGAAPPAFTRFPSVGFEADPQTNDVEVSKPAEGAADVIIEAYAVDAIGNQTEENLLIRVDGNAVPSGVFEVEIDPSTGDTYVLVNSVDSDTGSYRFRLIIAAAGVNAFDDPVYNDADPEEFSGAVFPVRIALGVDWKLDLDEALQLSGFFYRSTSSSAAAQLASRKSTNIRVSRVHGAQVPPQIAPRAIINADGSAADLYATLVSKSNETITLRFRDSDALLPEWQLCASAIDSTPLFVASGTEIDKNNWFTQAGLFAQKLNALPLVREQIKRVYFQAEGLNSGLESNWVPLTLDLKKVPWLESVTVTFDENADLLQGRIIGGANCSSVVAEFDDDPNIGSPAGVQNANLADGGSLSPQHGLAVSARGKPWYLGATPYNGVLVAGLPTGIQGVRQIGSTTVEGGNEKTIWITPSSFVPAVHTGFTDYLWFIGPTGISTPQDTLFQAYGSLILPPGVTITKIEANMQQDATGASYTQVTLLKLSAAGGGSAQVIGQVVTTTDGWQNKFALLTEIAAIGQPYALEIEILSESGSLLNNAVGLIGITYVNNTPREVI